MIHHASAPVLLLISAAYFMFAVQVWWQVRGRDLNKRSAWALIPLIVVFVFCALSGYLTSLMPADWWWFREFLHWILLAASAWLVLSNQALVIADILARHDNE